MRLCISGPLQQKTDQPLDTNRLHSWKHQHVTYLPISGERYQVTYLDFFFWWGGRVLLLICYINRYLTCINVAAFKAIKCYKTMKYGSKRLLSNSVVELGIIYYIWKKVIYATWSLFSSMEIVNIVFEKELSVTWSLPVDNCFMGYVSNICTKWFQVTDCF